MLTPGGREQIELPATMRTANEILHHRSRVRCGGHGLLVQGAGQRRNLGVLRAYCYASTPPLTQPTDRAATTEGTIARAAALDALDDATRRRRCRIGMRGPTFPPDTTCGIVALFTETGKVNHRWRLNQVRQ